MTPAQKATRMQAGDPVARNFINRAAGRLQKMLSTAAEDYRLASSLMIDPDCLHAYIHHPYIDGKSDGIYLTVMLLWYGHITAGENMESWNKKLAQLQNLLTNYKTEKQCISI